MIRRLASQKLLWLFLIMVGLMIGYLTFNTYGNWEFALQLRGKKIAAFLLVALVSSISTISFQTLTKNQFLTPGILGLDNLYVMIQTLLFFFAGGITMLGQESTGLFLLNVGIMALLSVLFIGFFLNKHSHELFLLLMVGMIAGTFFSSISSFLQVLMDPNEYDLLQGRLFASFGNINTAHLVTAAGLVLFCSVFFWLATPELDVLHLGKDHAINLGIKLSAFQKWSLLGISVMTGTATALVGPTIFLGFIVATISYQIFDTYRHRELFLGGFFIGAILLIGGQFLVEQIFQLTTTISTIIQFIGGIFFVGKIFSERKRI